MPSIYRFEHSREVGELLEELRDRISNAGPGVTLQGNRLTVRWSKGDELVDVHMIIESVTTPKEAADASRKLDELRAIYKKYPGIEAEMYHAEYGEWPK
jgi:hypothetical protein